jgi:hypothetical protein
MTVNKVKGATQALPLERFLRKEYMAKEVEDLINPNLIWDKILPHVAANAKSIAYLQDPYSHMTDPKKRTPPMKASLGEIPKVEISTIERKTDALKGWGMGFKFDEDIVLYEENIDDLVRTRNRVAWWLQEFINNWVINDMTNDWSTTESADTRLTAIYTHQDSTDTPGYESTNGHILIQQDSTYRWDAADADPVFDIIEWRQLFEGQEPAAGQRYGYRLTDVYLDNEDFYNLYKYLVEIDAKWQLDPAGDIKVPNIAGLTLHELQASMYDTDGTAVRGVALLTDRSVPAGTIYEAFDHRYLKSGPFNMHSYTENKDRGLNYDFWANRVTVMKEPKAFGVVYNLNANAAVMT